MATRLTGFLLKAKKNGWAVSVVKLKSITMYKLTCRACGKEHKNTFAKFPLALYNKSEIFEGKGKDKKSIGIYSVVIGYLCSKCLDKRQRSEFIKEHSIKPSPGQRIIDAIQSKIKNLKMKPKYTPPAREKPKLKNWEKIKGWTKEMFFKKRERE